jgi:hypothetical protein
MKQEQVEFENQEGNARGLPKTVTKRKEKARSKRSSKTMTNIQVEDRWRMVCCESAVMLRRRSDSPASDDMMDGMQRRKSQTRTNTSAVRNRNVCPTHVNDGTASTLRAQRRNETFT